MNSIPADASMEDDSVNVEEEANEIRKIYRNIRENISENRLEYINPNSDAIEATLENVENTFRNVKKPREAVSDSHVLLELAILGKERIRNVHCEFRSFNNLEFVEKMRNFMIGKEKRNSSVFRDEDSDSDIENKSTQSHHNSKNKKKSFYILTGPILSRFGEFSMNYFRVSPKPTFLLGLLEKEIPKKVKKIRQRKINEKKNDDQKTVIKELEENSSEKEISTTVTEIERIYKILKRFYKRYKGPICLYEFMINPRSFSRTIENVFYVSFLVKDGYARIYLDKESLPVIEPILENEPDKFDTNEISKKAKPNSINMQSMISLTKLEWKEIIETFKIEKAVIPDPSH
ncbi:non-structural maintenance of chromosomes element 4 -like protein [Brachionus plicatilis]|uniref:Non-structural maintenance of chromosomes element 4 n=1 Tax=Brachionus plicatilis TaxID=10195 RepID=A0A3M7T9J5_BRAPC|nr:non-structural maintenance of chromosomes element 4 -like protein [Brachionus plicatilis]